MLKTVTRLSPLLSRLDAVQLSTRPCDPLRRRGVGRWEGRMRCSIGSSSLEGVVDVARTNEQVEGIPGFGRQIRDLLGSKDGGLSIVGEKFEIGGWVRTIRNQKSFAFIEISDGSTLSNLQTIVNGDVEGYDLIKEGSIHTGSSISVSGTLVASPGGKQKVELKAEKLVLLGRSDPDTYPLQKKGHTLEFLRGIAHLRGRTNTMGAVMRVRSALCCATHDFFRSNGFYYIQTPIISGSDCEGAGEMFRVTTLLDGAAERTNSRQNGSKGEQVKGKTGWKDEEDFFGGKAYLTVSGQLNAEAYACAMGRVYTFGPTFRAENSNTSRHLAEFWMLEPEMAFCDLTQDIACAEAYLKYTVNYILTECAEDLALFDRFYQKGLVDRLKRLSSIGFERVTYTEAVEKLQSSGKDFDYPVDWGRDLQSEHERYLTEIIFDHRPVVVTDYPKDIKSFYMKLNSDGKTVAAMDVLVPGVGELIGGSQREDDYQRLKNRIVEIGLKPEDYEWYLDLRKYGSVPHSGFGLGFERYVQFVTGMENIRDVIPFPRYPGHCSF